MRQVIFILVFVMHRQHKLPTKMEVHKEIYTNLFVYQSFHLNEKKRVQKMSKYSRLHTILLTTFTHFTK